MTTFRPYAKHDPDADAIYVVLLDADVTRSHTLDDFRIIDYSDDRRVVGVEFLGVGGGIDLQDIPHREKVEKAIHELNLGIKIFA
ncbi:MAG: DUF2283 domain-containing protein [Dehalococcoidia bacterium]